MIPRAFFFFFFFSRMVFPSPLELLAAERPQIRIGKGRCVVVGVAERLSDRAPLGLEEFAGLPIGVPRLGEFCETDLVEPGFAVAEQDTERGPRRCEPALLTFRHRR